MSKKAKVDDKVVGYKAYGKDMKCRGFLFEEGKTYTHDGPAVLCESGFHFVENPLDALRYYNEGNFTEIEAEGVSPETGDDSKRVCNRITIRAKIHLSGLIKAGVSFLIQKNTADKTRGYYSHSATSGNYSPSATSGDCSHSATSGDCSHSATSGDCSHSATSGYYSHSATSGNCSHSATSGDYSHSATSGDYSHSATSGDCSHSATSGDSSHSATSGNFSPSATSGYYSHSATSGNCSHSATSGYYSHSATSGKESIAAAIGHNAKAKASLGNWIVVSEIDGNGKVLCIKTSKIDGKELKPDTWYKVVKGEFVATE